MSGPAGTGAGGKGAAGGQGALFNLVHKAKETYNPQASSTTNLAEKGPSKGLPSTGLKRNTQEWKDEHGEAHKGENGRADGDPQAEPHQRKTRLTRRASASSIPSDAEGDEDERTDEQRQRDQEGPAGRGPGKHEKDLSGVRVGPGHFTESPTEENPPEPEAGEAGEAPKANGTAHRSEEPLDTKHKEAERHPDRESGQQGDFKVNSRRKSTDELGRAPDGLPGVKDEEPPGPRNEIVLDPRISHIQYHQEVEYTGQGLKRGPVLKVTPDGEGEHPPGQTPVPSRQGSSADARRQRASDKEEDYERAMGNDRSDGTWRSAMENGHASPGQHQKERKKGSSGSRFSSFRTRPPAEQHDLYDSDGDEHDGAREAAQRRWQMLRSRVVPSRQATTGGPTPGAAKVSALSSTAVGSVPVTTELLAGQLPVMILKTWLDRDEEGNRAVPVLLGNLRFRVGDSVGLKQGSPTGKEMFKLECEYGDGAVKWVIYRELRDFVALHAHYRAANLGTSIAGLRTSRKVEIPDFPKMSIPYINKFSNEKGKEKPVGKAEYAQASRDALQQYLVDLIRAVIFRPESNRLCRFFELSSLTLSLAPRGGFQGKAGFLRMPGSDVSRRANQPGLSPVSWVQNRAPRWFIVRDSYFVATEGPESTEFYDVFLIDADFRIERPKRIYRTGFHKLSGRSSHDKADTTEDDDGVDRTNPLNQEMIVASGEGQGKNANKMHDPDEADASHHSFFIINSQRRIKLQAKNARQLHQFVVSMERISAQCIWAGKNRFDSFAPLRVNVAAQWLVDGRDYFWNLSRAINMAKERIYIHDWWISPELYLRRPGNERYRLDNLLKRKAEDGVKIFIIIYNEVSDKTTPVDSSYTKKTLTNLHPNIMVQRSPSHFQTGTFYWSHHEKLCVIDETIAFMGGLDLCYGRWDTSQHVLTDEDFTDSTGPNGPVWRGKDYSNERVVEFAQLDQPFVEMIDRHKVPRMPWHDVGLQIVGQPSRDLCRHFVQRWNLLIRTKNHTRKMPFLLPPPDFTERELEDLKLRGTCEVQICRSVGPWSMGTLEKIEHSIQNAYRKSIELSEHFVYIENQFFITSTVVDGVQVANGIGDALVDRIIRAHKEGTKWKACIVIPLLPGYTFPIDAAEASSVRLILECQNRTICRGTTSIFSRLRKEGIDPDEYINFFSLRTWGKFKSGALTTEQVYIHGKTMIVDDRLVLCGSANINERSQRGDRDSELVAVIRDTDMIDGTMAGKPFKVGRFAHTLRVRLMREHVGVDVDAIEEDQLMSRPPIADADEIETWDPDHEQEGEGENGDRGVTQVKRRTAGERFIRTVHSGLSSVTKGVSENAAERMSKAAATVARPVRAVVGGDTVAHHVSAEGGGERSDFTDEGRRETSGFASSVVPTLEEKTIFERRPSATHANGKPLFDVLEEDGPGEDAPEEAQVPGAVKHHETIDPNEKSGKSGVPRVIGKPGDKELYGAPANSYENDSTPPVKGTERSDPTEDEELAVKARKTLRKHLSARVGVSPWTMPTPTPIIDPNRFHDPLDDTFWKDQWQAVAVHNVQIFRKVFRCIPDDLITTWAQYKAFANHAEKFNKVPEDVTPPGQAEPVKVTHDGPGTHGAGGGGSGGGVVGQGDEKGNKSQGSASASPTLNESKTSVNSPEQDSRTPSGPNEAWQEWEKEEMEELLGEVRGHLVLYPTRFLEAEDLANNFLFNSDKILPLPIYD